MSLQTSAHDKPRHTRAIPGERAEMSESDYHLSVGVIMKAKPNPVAPELLVEWAAQIQKLSEENERLREACSASLNLVTSITGSRTVSIGSLNSHYDARISTERADVVLERLYEILRD